MLHRTEILVIKTGVKKQKFQFGKVRFTIMSFVCSKWCTVLWLLDLKQAIQQRQCSRSCGLCFLLLSCVCGTCCAAVSPLLNATIAYQENNRRFSTLTLILSQISSTRISSLLVKNHPFHVIKNVNIIVCKLGDWIWPFWKLWFSSTNFKTRDVVLGTCPCTWVVHEYSLKYLCLYLRCKYLYLNIQYLSPLDMYANLCCLFLAAQQNCTG